ncbi:NAD(P)/FAD-dependent oxidoreductase [Nocardiopsis coralliicola]
MRLFTSAAEMRAVPRSEEFRNGGVSLWYRDAPAVRRPPLPGPGDYDVCIVGAGFTGLWTAYYLLRADPSLRVAVCERAFAGSGAAGRGAGLLTADLPAEHEQYAADHGKGAAVALQRSLMASVDEVAGAAAEEGIDAGTAKGGMLFAATDPEQRDRLTARVERLQQWGYWPEDLHLVDRGSPQRPRIGALATAFTPHAGRTDPARLIGGLAAAVERRGGRIFEDTPVTRIHPAGDGRRPAAATAAGTIRADVVLRATDGYSDPLGDGPRRWRARPGAVIATEPMDDGLWEELGWDGTAVLGDAGESAVVARRTADGRLAVAGPGTPFRGADDVAAPPSIASLWRALARLFPAAAAVPIAHAWAGVAGVPDDRRPRLGFDPATGLAWAGGYSGNGAVFANLAGRTLRDLVRGERTALTRLPWSGQDRTARTLARSLHAGLARRAAERAAAEPGAAADAPEEVRAGAPVPTGSSTAAERAGCAAPAPEAAPGPASAEEPETDQPAGVPDAEPAAESARPAEPPGRAAGSDSEAAADSPSGTSRPG